MKFVSVNVFPFKSSIGCFYFMSSFIYTNRKATVYVFMEITISYVRHCYKSYYPRLHLLVPRFEKKIMLLSAEHEISIAHKFKKYQESQNFQAQISPESYFPAH